MSTYEETKDEIDEKNKFNPNDYLDSGFSLKEIKEMREAFEMFDTDHSGAIDKDELAAAMKKLGFEDADIPGITPATNDS